jgi:hypothetical protein
MNCPLCSRVLEPAALRKENFWCAICATEYLPDGKTIAPEISTGAAAPISFPVSEIPPGPPAKIAGKSFTVQIGSVTFTSQGSVDLDIAGTKVRVT